MTKTFTVHQLARFAGVSVRTLHHYDQIGLLKPAFIGENRYRYYGEDEMLRLQQILLHRELDMPLNQIGANLDAPEFDRLDSLRKQRVRIEQQAKRYAAMMQTIDRTILHLQGLEKLKEVDLYSGIVSPEKQAEYEAWLETKYGPDIVDHIAVSRQKRDQMSEAENAAKMEELRQIEQGLADELRRGVPPQSAALDPLISRHHDWVIAMWNQPASPSAYAGLADTYLAYPDFVARYEEIEPGFAQYLTSAMTSWAKRQA